MGTGSVELPSGKPEDVGLSSAKLGGVRDVMQRRVKENQIPGGVVAIARYDKLVFHESYGWQDKDAGIPMTTDSIFRFYSMSKVITIAAVVIMVDEGTLALDDPISKFFPEIANWKVKTSEGLIEPTRQMSIKDLMLHMSGMDEHDTYRSHELSIARDSTDIVRTFTSIPLICHPGDKFEYSRSIDLLGFIIEKVSGTSLADFLEERLFRPLGMVDTAFHVPAEKLDRFAMIYSRKGNLEDGFTLHGQNEEQMQVAPLLSKPKVAMGGMGIVGTAEDYIKFLMMITNGGEWEGRRYLSKKYVDLMTINQLPKRIRHIVFPSGIHRHGIGFNCGSSVVISKKNFEKNAPLEEFGWGGAASTHYWVRPMDGLAVVAMEQVIPYNRETKLELRPVIYEAVTQTPAQN